MISGQIKIFNKVKFNTIVEFVDKKQFKNNNKTLI